MPKQIPEHRLEPPTNELLNELLTSSTAEKYLTTITSTGNSTNMSLSMYLNELLKKYKLEISDIVERTPLSQSYAYEIFNGTKRNIGRDKLLQLALAMELNLLETQRLLKRALLSELYVKNERDAIIIHCIATHKTLNQTNQELNRPDFTGDS